MAKNKKTRHNDTPVETIPEVAAFQAVKARYEAFRQANPQFFDYLNVLQEEFNQTLEAAEKTVRARKVSCGDFELYQFSTTYKPEELLQAVGRERFLELGGKITTQTIYDIDKGRVDVAIERGDIPAEAAERVRVKSPKYHKPTKLVLP